MNSHFREMLSAFIAEGVEFLIVGAYALAAHGVPRATGDLDFWAVIGRDELIRNKRALGRTRDLADIEALDREQPAAPILLRRTFSGQFVVRFSSPAASSR